MDTKSRVMLHYPPPDKACQGRIRASSYVGCSGQELLAQLPFPMGLVKDQARRGEFLAWRHDHAANKRFRR